MEMHNGIKYQTIYGRVASYYLLTMAICPEDSADQLAYNLIKTIYEKILEAPDMLGLSLQPDLFFEPWERQASREIDVKIIRDAFKKIENVIAEFFTIIDQGVVNDLGLLYTNNVKASKLLKNILHSVELEIKDNQLIISPDLVVSLKNLITISKANVTSITDGPVDPKEYLYFSRGVFDATLWVETSFDRGLNADGQIIRLAKELEQRGYTKLINKDGKRISLDFVKTLGKKPAAVKMSWADKIHYGIELSFEDLRLEPYFLWLRMPNFKEILTNINDYSEHVKDFIYHNTKNCDGDRYCVQTDKTHTRPLAAIKVNDKMKCPLYPSFSMNTRVVSKDTVDKILMILDNCYDKE